MVGESNHEAPLFSFHLDPHLSRVHLLNEDCEVRLKALRLVSRPLFLNSPPFKLHESTGVFLYLNSPI